MKFRTLATLVALAVGASAQTSVPPNVQQSVLLVLATALPTDSVSYALASQSAFASEMASSLSAGNTPAWYQALPSDVKSLLPIIYFVEATATPSATPSITPIVSSSASATPSPSAAQSTGAAAAFPTAAVGAGVGAALGFLGMLAL
ncbi:hypothetical protein BKA66DRAFT_72922 [Pyrenochaeta sp. MPI-SDFR-AT-0127]|nr:hypothetical protein BKA66DRAFT_72922 [Pyrenochaeta sp. MPI-SDFR-AT-0127]